jgi:hypothetical protein
MVYSNLLKKHGSIYYLNQDEKDAIMFFLEKNVWYSRYDRLYDAPFTLQDLVEIGNSWFYHVNSFVGKINFETDILAYINVDRAQYLKLGSASQTTLISEFRERIESQTGIKTKEIGDTGEALIHGHECMKLKLAKREDLINKVVIIPTFLAMGFDIRSFEPDETIKCIEVKTTISNSALAFNRFHLTDNEWNVAGNFKEKYFVYRLMITRADIKLFVIKNPIDMYKKGHLDIKLENGAEVQFKPTAGTLEDILIWKK